MMQDNGFVPHTTYISTKKVAFWLKVTVLIIMVAYIAFAVRRQQHEFQSVRQYWATTDWLSPSAILLLLLAPVNWTLEALKWKILIQRMEVVSLGDAIKGVLAGLSLGFALPAQLGDTAGRVLSLRSSHRWQSIGAALVSGGMQFYAALLCGYLALLLLPQHTLFTGYPIISASLLFFILLGVVLVYFRRRTINWKNSWLHRLEKYWSVAAHYSNRELLAGMTCALLRYLTFSIQFFLALHLFNVHLSIQETASGIGLVYLSKTLIPAFNLLSDLGVREASSLWVFGQWNVPAPQILSATLTLWLVNILTPVLVGLIWVWKLKLGSETRS